MIYITTDLDFFCSQKLLLGFSVWLSMIKARLLFAGSEKPNLFRKTTFLPITPPFPLIINVTCTLQKHKTPSCFVLNTAFCTVSNQPFVQGDAKPHKESSCSLAVAIMQLPQQKLLDAQARSGCSHTSLVPHQLPLLIHE